MNGQRLDGPGSRCYHRAHNPYYYRAHIKSLRQNTEEYCLACTTSTYGRTKAMTLQFGDTHKNPQHHEESNKWVMEDITWYSPAWGRSVSSPPSSTASSLLPAEDASACWPPCQGGSALGGWHQVLLQDGAAARITGSGQPGPQTHGNSQRRGTVHPDLISSSLPKNPKQTQTFYNSINLVRVQVN
jgi:hypothetical protein